MNPPDYIANGIQKHQPPGYTFRTDDYEQFQLIYVSHGELWFADASDRIALGPGGIALLRKQSAFELFCKETGYRGVAFTASGNLPQDFVGPAETVTATAELRVLAELMERQVASPIGEFAEVFRSLGRTMTWEAIRLSRTQKRRGNTDRTPGYWVRSACEILDATVYSNRPVRDVLSALPLSYRQLSRHFTEMLHITPKEYQVQLRMREAKHLLTETRLSITQIAMELGYSSSQHFATQFLEVIGLQPSAFREEIRP